jgi:Sulfotransferase family
MLTPILVAGVGRSGTTAVMSLLATDTRVALDRVYPFENRYLTYLAKLAILLERQDPDARVTGQQLHDFDDSRFGAHPWDSSAAILGDPRGASRGFPSGREFLHNLWHAFSARMAHETPHALFYAEKVPCWMPALLAECVRPFTIYLFRDPRDIYLSANAFNRKHNRSGFGRSPSGTDLDQIRWLAHQFLGYFENYFMDPYRKDCMLVRYEDIVHCKENLVSSLEQHLSLKSNWDNALTWPEIHQTALDLTSSANRWQREPLSAEVETFLQTHLHLEMAHLDYQIASPADPLPSWAFLDLAQVPHSDHGQLELKENATEVSITHNDFWMALPVAPFDAATVSEIWVSLKGSVGDLCSVYWNGEGQAFSEQCCSHLPFKPGLHWQILRFRVATHPSWRGAITGLRLYPFHGHGPAMAGTGSIRCVRLVQ